VIPLYGFLAGDTIGLLVLAHPDDRAADLCAKLESAASVRVGPLLRPVVMYRGQRLAPTVTVAEANIGPLERIDVVEGRP
jgi:toluene-4-monooxygenase system protein B